MPDVADRRIIQPSPVLPEYTLARARTFWKGQAGSKVSPADIDAITAEVWRLAGLLNIDPCLCFDQISVETNNGCFTGSVPASACNPAGIGALTNSSEFVQFPDWPTGVLAYFVHLLAWLGRLDLVALLTDREASSLDPRAGIVVQVRQTKGEADTWRSLARLARDSATVACACATSATAAVTAAADLVAWSFSLERSSCASTCPRLTRSFSSTNTFSTVPESSLPIST